MYAGVRICNGGNPTLLKCSLNRNGYVGVWIYDKGTATVEQCDLTGNAQGAWNKPFFSKVRQSGNRE